MSIFICSCLDLSLIAGTIPVRHRPGERPHHSNAESSSESFDLRSPEKLLNRLAEHRAFWDKAKVSGSITAKPLSLVFNNSFLPRHLKNCPSPGRLCIQRRELHLILGQPETTARRWQKNLFAVCFHQKKWEWWLVISSWPLKILVNPN